MLSQADPYLLIPCLILLGSAVIMLIYHLLINLQYHDKQIWKYCFYLFSISLFFSLDMYARIYAEPSLAKKDLIVSAVNFIVILAYASFIMETVAAWKKKYRLLFAAWGIASATSLLYIFFCFFSALSGFDPGEHINYVLAQVVRILLIAVGFWAIVAFLPLLNDRFMRWIKWGAVIYLFFMALVMIAMVTPDHKMLGLAPMHFVYLGTFFDVVFFSLAMSYKIKDILQRVTDVKNKLSRDLHDDIGASLSSIQIYSSVAEKTMQEDTEKAKHILRQIRDNAEKVMEDMSDIVWAMNTEKGNEMGFSGRIKNYGYELLSQKNIVCQYRIDSKAEQRLLRPESRKDILLIVKEALNNIAKYSGALQAEVEITLVKNEFVMTISDNGKGFAVTNALKGNGLKNMKQRASALGGRLEISSAPGKGTVVYCCIPLTSISDNG